MKADLKETAIRQAMGYLQNAYAGRARLNDFIEVLYKNKNCAKDFKLEYKFTGDSAGNWTKTLDLADMPFDCIHAVKIYLQEHYEQVIIAQKAKIKELLAAD